MKNNFFDNVKSFQNLYEQEKKIRDLTIKKEISFICRVEEIGINRNRYHLSNQNVHLKNCILDIYNKLPIPLKRGQQHFISSLSDPNTILITLRIKRGQQQNQQPNQNNEKIKNLQKTIDIVKDDNICCEEESIIGYVKGGPIEKYEFRRGTFDENYGKRNTVYMEWICIKPGYWGSTGGHFLRMNFLLEAKKRGYKFVTGYVHRNVIMKRISKGETIQIVQKYDPDKLDYYRIDLNGLSINTITEEDSDEFATVAYP